jgi:hypothetical protein
MQEGWEERWKEPLTIPPRFTWTLGGLLAVGVVIFLTGLLLDPGRAWQIYLVNFLFWGPVAQGAVVFAAGYHVVSGKWGPPIRRLAEGMAAFLPVSLVLFLPLYFGLDLFFGQIRELNPDRGAWFDFRFIFVRGGLGIGSMTVLSLLFVYYSFRPEMGLLLERGLRPRQWLYGWLTEGWQGEQAEIQRSERGMDVLAAGVLLAYPIIYSFMAFDLIMALDPFWYSSLFGAHFFISTFYLGLAGVTVVTALLSLRGSLDISSRQLSDLGKLLFGFSLLYMAMLWSQYVVIWYGNLPEETHFVVLRLWEKPWAVLSWSVLFATFFLPCLVFLSRQAKQTPSIMLTMGTLIAAGLWLERYVLVVPSLWHGEGVPFGWLEIGVTAGFFGVAGLSYMFFLQHIPIVPRVRLPVVPDPSHTGEKALEATAPRT